MKIHVRPIIGLGLLLLLWQPHRLSAQETTAPAPPPVCQDVLYLTDGSQLRGQITATKDGGSTLAFRTWSGIEMAILRTQVKRIVQRCSGDKSSKAYDFTEKGLYHHTRGGVMIGQNYYGENVTGVHLHHSSGWMFSRLVGVGLGVGVDNFGTNGNDVATYPVFAEFRSYLMARRITPFISVAGGWAFAGSHSNDDFGRNENWSGGWTGQANVGYRIGNNFTVNAGIRLQQKTRDWTSTWGGTETGTDRILHKRFVLSFGLLL